jgi:hypothetical protein
MAIKFDEKPSQGVIDKLHEARWTWKPAEGRKQKAEGRLFPIVSFSHGAQ